MSLIMYLWGIWGGADFSSFYDFSTGFLKWSDTLDVFFLQTIPLSTIEYKYRGLNVSGYASVLKPYISLYLISSIRTCIYMYHIYKLLVTFGCFNISYNWSITTIIQNTQYMYQYFNQSTLQRNIDKQMTKICIMLHRGESWN